MSVGQGETRGRGSGSTGYLRTENKKFSEVREAQRIRGNIIERKFTFFLILLHMVPAVPVKHLLINCSLMERDNRQRKEQCRLNIF